MAKPEIQFVGPVIDRRPKPLRNGYAKWGFLVTFLSCGALAPLGLLLSLRGLFSRPKTLAIFSTVVNGAICALIFLPITVHIAHDMKRAHRRHEHARRERNERDQAEVAKIIAKANERIAEYVAEHHTLPDGVSGNKLIYGVNDLWEQPLRYESPLDLESTTYTIRSAGRDKKFDTRDDIHMDYTLETSRNASGASTTVLRKESDDDDDDEIDLRASSQRVEIRNRNGRVYLLISRR